MSMKFEKLKRVRDALAKIPVTQLDHDTLHALIAAIDDLDDAMVADERAVNYARSLPVPQDITPDYLAIFAGTATTGGELVA